MIGRLTSSVGFGADEVHLESIESERWLMIVEQLNASTTCLVDRTNTQLVLAIRPDNTQHVHAFTDMPALFDTNSRTGPFIFHCQLPIDAILWVNSCEQ